MLSMQLLHFLFFQLRTRYTEEAPAQLPNSGLPSNWPTEGVIEARALTVKYRPELPAVLKGLRYTCVATPCI